MSMTVLHYVSTFRHWVQPVSGLKALELWPVHAKGPSIVLLLIVKYGVCARKEGGGTGGGGGRMKAMPVIA